MSKRWRILLLDTKEANLNHYIAVAISRALAAHPSVESVHIATYPDALSRAIRNRCNLLLAYGGEEVDLGICKRLTHVCGRSIFWLTEDPFETRVNLVTEKLFDLIFTNDSASVNAYRGRAEHLPLAAARAFHYFPVPETDKDDHYFYDIAFIGAAWPNRVAFLKDVLKRLPGVKAKLALATNECLRSEDLHMAADGYSWSIPSAEIARPMAMFANRSRITLTLHRTFSGSGSTTLPCTPGPRLFETALGGAFQLVDLLLPECAEYFAMGSEIDGFHTAEECAAKIHQYLQDPDRRLTMARAAQQRCLDNHLYEHRVGRIMDRLERVDATIIRRVDVRPEPTARILHVLNEPDPSSATEGNNGSRPRFDGTEQGSWRFQHLTCYLGSSSSNGSGVSEPLLPERTTDALADREREFSFANLLHRHRVDLVHFHGLPQRPATLPLVARTLGVPVVVSDPQAGESTAAPAPARESTRCSLLASILRNTDALLFADQKAQEAFCAGFPVPSGRVVCQVVDPKGEEVGRVYERLLDDYRIGERSEEFFSEEPLPRLAKAYNLYRSPSMDASAPDASRVIHAPAKSSLSNLPDFWRQNGTLRTLRHAGGVLLAGCRGVLGRLRGVFHE